MGDGSGNDIWSTGDWGAGPIEPLVRPYVDLPPDVPREYGVLQKFGDALANRLRDARSRGFATAMLSPLYVIDFISGFQRGSMAGGLRACADWVADLQKDIEIYSGEPLALQNVLFDELLRGFFDPNPQGLSKDTREVIAASELLAPLKMLGVLTASNDIGTILQEVGILLDDVASACITAGDEWLKDFFKATGNASEQGTMLGEFVGVAYVSVIRFWIESAIQDAVIPVP